MVLLLNCQSVNIFCLIYMMKYLLFFLFTCFTSLGFSQCYIITYNNNKRVLKVEGDYVITYQNNKRLYKFDGEYLSAYSNNRRLLKFDGEYIINYYNNRRVAKIDGEYLLDYSNNKRVAKLECPGGRSALAAAAYFFL